MQRSILEPAFLEEAVQHSLLKRRPSKKIKKIANSIYKSKSKVNKTVREQDQTKIIDILASRNVPEFLIEFIKKKRIFSMSSIRKISIKNQENTMPSTAEFLSRQEGELFQILQQDKIWREERKKYSQATPLFKKDTVHTKLSAQAQSSSLEIMNSRSFFQDQNPSAQQYPSVSMFHLMDQDQPRSLMMSRKLHDMDCDFFLGMF